MTILAGIRVVELGQVLAGPFAGAILADLGAEVLKVEKPGGGDDARNMGVAFRHGDSLTFHEMNRGKGSVVLDLQSEDGLAALHALLGDADILVHNLRPGVPEALGIDAEIVVAQHPRLIYCAMSAFGHVGPMRGRPGYEPLLQAFAGLCAINGAPDGPPARIGPSVVDLGTGMWTVIGALAALQRRERTGRGGIVNTSLFETALVWAGQRMNSFVNEGTIQPRVATGHPNLVPYQAFETTDGPMMICCGNDRLFVRLARALDRPGWGTEPRFASNRQRLANRDELVALITERLATKPRAAWQALLTEIGVPNGPLNTIPEVAADPQMAAIGLLQSVPGEDFRLLGLPVSFEGERPAIRCGAPRLGAARPPPLPPAGA